MNASDLTGLKNATTENKKNVVGFIAYETSGDARNACLSKERFKVAQNSFQHIPRLRFSCDHYSHTLSIDATITLSKNCPIIGEI